MKTWTTSAGNKIIRVLAGRSNVFLLTNGKANVLVDTSPGFMWKALQKRLDELNIDHIDYLILTHSHFDHSANAAKVREKYKAQVVIHRSEAKYLLSGDNILPSGTNAFTRFMVRAFAERFRSFVRYQPCKFDHLVDESYDLSAFGFNAYLMHTPGHTEGSISLIIDDDIALVGDTMFGVFSWTVFTPFANDQKQLLISWEKLLKTKCRIFLPSHGSANSRSQVLKDFNKRVVGKSL